MPSPPPATIRSAHAADADAIADIHAASWRRHYRGAYSDDFLDGDIATDRRAVWNHRLIASSNSRTIVADGGGELVGFVHVVLDEDPAWGSLVDNLHVVFGRQRSGLGRTLPRSAANAAAADANSGCIHLWVLQQNAAAQAFYRAHGGSPVEAAPVTPPGGIPSRLCGTPHKLRFAWPDVHALASGRT